MPTLAPCKRREFIRKMRALGYDGPYAGGKHGYMSRTAKAKQTSAQTVTVPNTDLDVKLLILILNNTKIDRTDFINA
jgi:predicted RNA binding protein YcfA (HicA-like mRNA interferase family)